MTYDPAKTALLLVDPYDDFLSEGGKLWPRAKAIAEEVNLLDNLRSIVATARSRGIVATPPTASAYFRPPRRGPIRRGASVDGRDHAPEREGEACGDDHRDDPYQLRP